MNEILIAAFAATTMGLLLSRKLGPFGIFRKIKNNSILNHVFKCETCTLLWFGFILRASLGIIPNWRFVLEILATGGLTLAVAGLAQIIVIEDEDEL